LHITEEEARRQQLPKCSSVVPKNGRLMMN